MARPDMVKSGRLGSGRNRRRSVSPVYFKHESMTAKELARVDWLREAQDRMDAVEEKYSMARDIVIPGSTADVRMDDANIISRQRGPRATDEDRHAIITRLDDAYAAGAITRTEHEARASIALETTTQKDLSVLTEDLPVRIRRPLGSQAGKKAVSGWKSIPFGYRGAISMFGFAAQFFMVLFLSGTATDQHAPALSDMLSVLSGIAGLVGFFGSLIWMMMKADES